MSSAYAADEPIVDTVRSVDAAVPLDRAIALRPAESPATRPAAAGPGEASGSAGGSSGSTGTGTNGGTGGSDGTVDQLLHSQIRGGGLPLPGQATAVPDAFAIAAVLLPAVPPQGQGRPPSAGSDGGRPELSTGSGGLAGRTGANTIPAARTGDLAGDGWSGADQQPGQPAGVAVRPVSAADAVSAAVVAARTAELAAFRDSARTGLPRVRAGGLGADVAGSTDGDGAGTPAALDGTQPAAPRHTTASGPLAATGSEYAVLIPIAAGLLLTGAAMYKHRGLPRGH
ncbi:hypothetical protein P3T36_006176 [Kitasatospora sp. MAP12-15]|uniref:hypothetical protein n=1 Tax=unclassified Kitasatospora TaxID=2633591 RepID=UPI002473F4AF|nr:hypothetical protein [Kitasatospora sp. MAP12-44]MDH6110570.1 hypothetical protein [Kitasatospora sp. MAP12-44]